MSREIKYKAWLKDAKCFAEIRHISFFEGKTVVKIYDQPMSEEVWFELEDLELLQFTGLKDKNGVDIYEGDILRRYNNAFDKSDGYEIFKVKYQAFGYQLHVINNGKTTNNIKYWSVYHANKEDEVIGNIYENKNLLEEK